MSVSRSVNPNNAINHRAHREYKRETISFYDFLCALFYVRLNLIIFKKITREHRELLEIKSLFKVKNTSVNSVVLFKCIFWVKINS